nr:hypothetical protein Iba_chr13dCG11650 [Ipomoea batatas]
MSSKNIAARSIPVCFTVEGPRGVPDSVPQIERPEDYMQQISLLQQQKTSHEKEKDNKELGTSLHYRLVGVRRKQNRLGRAFAERLPMLNSFGTLGSGCTQEQIWRENTYCSRGIRPKEPLADWYIRKRGWLLDGLGAEKVLRKRWVTRWSQTQGALDKPSILHEGIKGKVVAFVDKTCHMMVMLLARVHHSDGGHWRSL